MTVAAACRPVDSCLACGAPNLKPVLDLGVQPLANNLVRPAEAGAGDTAFPLGVQLCSSCLLVQLTHVVDPALMFSSYLYVPSTSSTWLQHCEELADWVCAQAELERDDFVVEIGSNDGSLLRAFQRRGQRVLGVDPASNIAAQANSAGVPTLNRFFSEVVAQEIREQYGLPRAVVSTNVLAHVPDPVGLLRGVRALLGPRGVYVNESPSLRDLVVHNEFDTIYHEHVSYLSLSALVNLFERAALELVDAAPQAVHGGTLRVLGVADKGARAPSQEIRNLLEAERKAGVIELAGLAAFAQRTRSVRDGLLEIVASLRETGQSLAAYGATAKGNTLLGYCGLTSRDVAYIVDRNPLKQGLLTPGSRIPIVSTERLEANPPDVLLLLAWNLADEIRQQLAWFAEQGGRFLVPVPKPCLV